MSDKQDDQPETEDHGGGTLEEVAARLSQRLDADSGSVDLQSQTVGRVSAGRVTMQSSAARQVGANALHMRESAAGWIKARAVEATESGVGGVAAQDVTVHDGTVGLVVARQVRNQQGRIGLLVAGRVEGNVEPLMGFPAALALGAALGLVFALVTRLLAVLSRAAGPSDKG